MNQFSRRDFLRLSALAGSGLFLSTALTGCAPVPRREELSVAGFEHGVASGDPLRDAVILWTRASVPQGTGPVTLAWELALDPTFADVLRSGTVTCGAAGDYTVKIDVRDLQPGTRYHYRFLSRATLSPAGRTATLPAGSPRRLRMAVFSCSNYPAGYFNVYRLAARTDDLDVVLHLGDYIYEYGAGGYGVDQAQSLGRNLPVDNDGELFTLTDYRRRYALYRSDGDLQALHAALPFLVVWDDHEIANNTWTGGAQNHNPGEGDFLLRRAAAIQAYYEWLPIRPPMGPDDPRIYRRFDAGDLVSVHMLDTRVIGRDRQLEYGDFFNEPGEGNKDAEFDAREFRRRLNAPDRRLLGERQITWLEQGLAESPAAWQLFGQQVLMGRMHLPAELMAGSRRRRLSQAQLRELVMLKTAMLRGETLNLQQQARLAQVLPLNLDAWDGYPAERERIYERVRRLDRRLIVVAGDTHNAWCSSLTDHQGRAVGTEFATASVSSPGMETYLDLGVAEAEELARALPVLIDDLRYCNVHQRGFLTLTFEPSRVEAHWRFVDTVTDRAFSVAAEHRESVTA